MEQITPAPEKSDSSVRTGTEEADHAGPSPSVDAGSEVQEGPVNEEIRPSDSNVESQLAHDFRQLDLSPSKVLEEVDEFLQTTSGLNGGDDSPFQVPKSVEVLSETVESMIEKYVSGDSRPKFGDDPVEDFSFFDSIDRLSKLADRFGDLSSTPKSSPPVDRASAVLQRSMSFLEDELRTILENSICGVAAEEPDQPTKSLKAKYTSFNSHPEPDRCASRQQDPEAAQSVRDEFPGFTPEAISRMHQIANSMISAGYENECCMVYNVLRRNGFKSALTSLGFDIISIDEVQRMQWESLEGEITLWISIVKECSSSLFPKERDLCESVFSDHDSISRSLFGNLARSVCIQFLNFAEAVVLTKRSAEKLFKMLDMYETMGDLVAAIDAGGKTECLDELKSELLGAKNRLAEAAVNIFTDLENSIKSDNSRTAVPSGAVHPLTRYTMNYLKYACEYRDTLEQVFKSEKTGTTGGPAAKPLSPFAMQLMTVMELLDANLDMKSKLYKDPALRYIFLMNNGRYIHQKIKGSTVIHELMGDTWCRRRSSDLRGYHKSYQRETWYRLLQCLNNEGLLVNGKVSKPVLKEKFKSFNATFDDIHKTQSSWVVSDEQLQSELRVSVSAVVTPAYRSFLGRFSQYLDPGRQTEKYIKYQPEDIEALIDDLFDGNRISMGRRKS